MTDSTFPRADAQPRTGRIAAIDLLRGLALIAMAVYHFSWDLANVHLVNWGVASEPLWRDFAKGIAGTFLLLAGVSLVLAHRDGIDFVRFTGRLLRIAGGAVLVSAASWYMFPDAWIFFGILHMMVAGSLAGLLVLRLPPLLLVLLAAGAMALPVYYFNPALDPLPYAIIGLSDTVPVSNDFVPFFPWIGPMLAGMALGRWIADGTLRLPQAMPHVRPFRGLAQLGRWSLVFYLVHQPVLYGIAEGLAAILPVNPAVERTTFISDCKAECGNFGAGEGYCTAFCGCVASSLDGTDIWKSRGPNASFGPLIATAASTCQGAGDDGSTATEDPSDD
jgi:uncharacterized membrane protein